MFGLLCILGRKRGFPLVLVALIVEATATISFEARRLASLPGLLCEILHLSEKGSVVGPDFSPDPRAVTEITLNEDGSAHANEYYLELTLVHIAEPSCDRCDEFIPVLNYLRAR